MSSRVWQISGGYEGERGFKPAAYANLARLKQPAAELFARVQRP